MPDVFNTDIEFFQPSGLLEGGSGLFFKDIHLDASLSLSEPDHTQLSGFSTKSIVGALNTLKDNPPGGGDPVDVRAVTGAIIPDTSGEYPLGNFDSPFLRVASVSGIFTDRIRLDPKGEDPVAAADVNVVGDVWLRQNRGQFETLAIVGESGICGLRSDQGIFDYRIINDITPIANNGSWTDVPLEESLIALDNTSFYAIEEGDTVFFAVPGVYRVTYTTLFENTDASDQTLFQARILFNGGVLIYSESFANADRSPIGSLGISKTLLLEASTGDKIKLQVAVGDSKGASVGDLKIGTHLFIELLRYASP
ncbi:MAG: hypothetical protein ACXABY_01755 [Candidatus Thorarchaeota archaeon]|jgi:hypothetical protein